MVRVTARPCLLPAHSCRSLLAAAAAAAAASRLRVLLSVDKPADEIQATASWSVLRFTTPHFSLLCISFTVHNGFSQHLVVKKGGVLVPPWTPDVPATCLSMEAPTPTQTSVKATLRRFRHAQLSKLNLSVLDDVSETDEAPFITRPSPLRASAGPMLRPVGNSGLYKLPTPHVNPFVQHDSPDEPAADATDAAAEGSTVGAATAAVSGVTTATGAAAAAVPRFVSPPTVPRSVTTPRITPSPSTSSIDRPVGVQHKRLLFERDARTQRRVTTPPKSGAPLPRHSHSGTFPQRPSRPQLAATQHVSRYLHDFEQLGVIASGNFGLVTRCRQRVDGVEYAIKRIGGDSQRPGSMSKKVAHKEIFALAALDTSPHVVRYYQSWIEDGSIYIQLELCETSLHNQIKDRRGLYFPENDITNVLRQVTMGLNHLHSNDLVHLDIKPENILVRAGVYKIGDLGMVTQVKGPNSHDDLQEGDVRFLAREVLRDNREQLQKADIFSLGASVYSMMICRDLPRNGPEWNNIRDGQLRVRVKTPTDSSVFSLGCAIESSGGGGGASSVGEEDADPRQKRIRLEDASAAAILSSGDDHQDSDDDDTGDMSEVVVATTPTPAGSQRDPSAPKIDDDERSSWPEYHSGLVQLVQRLMHPKPEDRPSTAVVLKNDILASGVESKLRRERAFNKLLATQLKKSQNRPFRHSSLGVGGIGAGSKRKLTSTSLPFAPRAVLKRSETT